MATKATKTKVIEKKEAETPKGKKGRYHYAVGRRKTATAQVRLYPAKENKGEDHTANQKPIETYFSESLRPVVIAPLSVTGLSEEFIVSATVRGGGVMAQAEAIRLGVARALLLHDEALRPSLRANGLMTRDARSVERKKPGLKKARRAPQWSKR